VEVRQAQSAPRVPGQVAEDHLEGTQGPCRDPPGGWAGGLRTTCAWGTGTWGGSCTPETWGACPAAQGTWTAHLPWSAPHHCLLLPASR